MMAIEMRWGCALIPAERHIIKEADLNMLSAEARRFYGQAVTVDWDLKWPSDDATSLMTAHEVWGFDKAKQTFLDHFNLLVDKQS